MLLKEDKKKEGSPTMLIWAIFLDILGIITAILIFLFGVGLLFSTVLDFIGVGTVGWWAWIKIGSLPPTKKSLKNKYLKKFGWSFLWELIPFVGALFWWTRYVRSINKELNRSPN